MAQGVASGMQNVPGEYDRYLMRRGAEAPVIKTSNDLRLVWRYRKGQPGRQKGAGWTWPYKERGRVT